MELTPTDMALLRREIVASERALAAARTTADPLQSLTDLTSAIETLNATQHELVNVLLDRGASWSTLAAALSTNNAAAQRRYPRRGTRNAGPDPTAASAGEPPIGEPDNDPTDSAAV